MDGRGDGEAIARAAGAIADTTRATMLLALMDGRAWTASELAKRAGVSRSTATEHLHLLVDAGLVRERHAGRHRYLRLADSRAASLVETLSVGINPAERPTSWCAADADAALRAARTCYDHLAGALGVAVHGAFAERGYLDPAASTDLTGAGAAWCAAVGMDVAAIRAARRPTVLLCLDWTERREHLAGALGAALLTRFRACGWLDDMPGSRAVRVTPLGREALVRHLGLPFG